jgi:hypothetical protein
MLAVSTEELRLLAHRNATPEEVVRDAVRKGRHYQRVEETMLRNDREGRPSTDGRSLAERRAALHDLLEQMTVALIARLGELR